MLISQKKPQLDLKALELPKLSLNQMRQRLKLDTETLSRIKDDIRKHSVYRQALGRANAKLTQEIVFQQALDGMGSSQGVSFIRGYIPQEHEKKILSHAKESGWGILIEEVRDEDDPPTLLRNPGWVELISPVFRLLEIIPGYRELDISPVFLIFLGLFFGMIIGDAGYACVYVVLTYLAQKKFGPRLKSKKIFFLLYFFSGCAFFWGLLTGVAFGQGWFLRAGFRPITPLLNDTKFLQTFCFFLGAFHLSLAHLWQLARKLPSPGALCDLGWILILWAAFFLARTLILNSPYPFFGNWLVISGICLVVICTRPQRNIFKMLIQGLGTLALSLVNNFTDVVSYVRLFAVGLAGIAIADTVNAIASQFGSSSRLAAAIIVLIGHSINLLLGPLSVLVHGVRLNVLEFSSHLGLSWSGVSYKPLKA